MRKIMRGELVLTLAVLAGSASAKPPPPPPCNPADNQIAYIGAPGDGPVYTMTWTGSCKTLIYGDTGSLYPAWSPDGAWLIFENHTGQSGVYKIPATGGTPSLIVAKSSAYLAGSDWSPTTTLNGSQMIAFTDTGVGGDHDLFVVKPDGTGKQNLTNDVEAQFHPSWSRLGDQIAVSRGDAAGVFEIVIYDLALDAGGALYIASETNVTDLACSPLGAASFVGVPSFARTSDDLLIMANIAGSRNIWRVDPLDPCNPVNLTNIDFARFPCWRNDDSQFVHTGPNKGKDVGWRRNAVDGSGATVLGNNYQTGFGCRP